jgi:hypothetical protein
LCRCFEQIVNGYKRKLLRYLEFAGFNHFTVEVAKLENIDTPVEIIQVESGLGRDIILFKYFSTQEINDLEVQVFLVRVLKFKNDKTDGWVGIKLDRTVLGRRFSKNPRLAFSHQTEH